MPRVRLIEAKEYAFKWEIPVRVTDLNAGGHLSNDKMLQFMHDARHNYVRSRGFENEMVAGVIVADVIVNYKKEVFFNDILTLFIAFDEIKKNSIRFLYKIINKKAELVALAESGVVFIDYATKKIKEMPSNFIESNYI